MTKTEMLDKINALETEIANLRAELEKPDTPGPWVPEKGEKFWLIYNFGAVNGQYQWDNDAFDRGKLSIGNIFRTREDAEFMLERLKVLAELRRLAKGFVPDWGNKHQNKWLLVCWDGSIVRADFTATCSYGAPVYFQSREDAQAAIEAVGAERLKKYYFMVGELGSIVDKGFMDGLGVDRLFPSAQKVIFHDPATIVYWSDDTKTMVKCSENDVYSKETGLALCYMKRALLNSSRKLNDELRKWCEE